MTPAVESVPPLPGHDADVQRDRAMAVGLAWTGAAKWIGQSIAWIATLVVARLLTPEDYGLVALGTVYLGLITLVTEFGLGSAVVMLRELDARQTAQINSVAWLAGVAGFGLSLALASPIGAFFHSPLLVPVLVVMSIAFLASGPRIVPQSMLQKEMRFRVLSLIDAAQVMIQNGTMVLFAVLGFRYWAIVLGGLAGQFAATFLTLAVQRCPLAKPQLASIGKALSFSRDVAATRLAWFFYSRADFVVAGRVLGGGPTGYYSMAWSLASIPVDKLSALVHKVTPAFFSLVQKEPLAIRRYFVILIQGLATLSFPFSIGTALVAPDFIIAILTEKWTGAIAPLQILSLYACLASLNAVLTPLLAAVRQQRFTMWSNLAAAVILPVGFLVGARWGTTGIAFAWLLLHPPIVLALLRHVVRHTSVTWRDVGSALWPPVQASFFMTAAVLIARFMVLDGISSAPRLAALVVIGAVTFVAAFAIFSRAAFDRMRRALALLRQPAAT